MEANQNVHESDRWHADRCNVRDGSAQDAPTRSASGGGVRRFKVRKTFTLDPESIGFIDEICQARNLYSGLMKRSFVQNQSQVVRDAINLLYRFEVGKESLVHDEDPRYA